MNTSSDFYNYLRNKISISSIIKQSLVLQQKGNEYLGICPFHNEKTPSFTVNDIKKFYHCFGCGAHGDVIKFISEMRGVSYKNAAIIISNDHGIELPKVSEQENKIYQEVEEIYDTLNLATKFFQHNIDNRITEYLQKRGLNLDSIKDFSIGFAPGGGSLEEQFKKYSIPLKSLLKSGLFRKNDDGRIYEVFNNRIMFPIYNIYNKVVGFGGRSLDNRKPKYINSPETIAFKKSEVVYGENVATSQSHKDNYFIIVEGYMDVISLHQCGFKQSVASLGTSVTEKHIQKLWSSVDEIVVCLDGDIAGDKAIARLVKISLPQVSAQKIISFVMLPIGYDPDDLVNKGGASAFKSLLDKRIGLSEMIWRIEFYGKVFTTAESRSLLEKKLNDYSFMLKDKILKAHFKRYFQDMIWRNLIHKKSHEKLSLHNSNKLLVSTKYSEIEYIENTICTFIIKFPDLIFNADDIIYFQDNDLEDFKHWIIELAKNYNHVDVDLIINKVKNTRFYNRFLVLFSSDIIVNNYTFLDNKNINVKQVFEWLHKKHYAALLKNECINILKNTYSKQSKVVSYLKEIRRVTTEVDNLSNNFIKDQLD